MQRNTLNPGKLNPSLPLLGFFLAYCVGATVPAQSLSDQRPTIPAEELRLDAAAFRAGLKKLGLGDVLELHLRDFPPTDEVARCLMTRDIRMAEFADRSLDEEQRQHAATEANAILDRLVAEQPDDPRRFDWQFQLAHSLIYDQAEASLTRRLFYESSREDAALAKLTSQALDVVDSLLRDVANEYKRIDALPADEFDALERTGHVERLDQLAPRAEYLRLWVYYYDARSRSEGDPVVASRLNNVRSYFRRHQDLLTTPHDLTHVQVQALSLAGMVERALQDHANARDVLSRALTVVNSLDDGERSRIAWAVSLAWIERARNERDDRRFDDAIALLDRFRKTLPHDSDGFALRLATAMLERSVWYARAEHVATRDEKDLAETIRAKGRQAMVRLIETEPQRRDEVFAAVYQNLDPHSNPDQLDPFEQCAMAAGLISESRSRPEAADELLQRAKDAAERFVSASAAAAPTLAPLVLFNLGVIEYQLGNARDAATHFLDVAREYPESDKALRAATLAVELESALHIDNVAKEPDMGGDASSYRASLEWIVEEYPDTQAGKYWRFFYAQMLDELSEHQAAAAQYALVDPQHELYAESIFMRLRALAVVLQGHAITHPSDAFELRHQAQQIARLEGAFAAAASAHPEVREDAQRSAAIEDMLARARVLTAETLALPQVGQAQTALGLVEGFESRFPSGGDHLGRIWRVRLQSLEQLGRLSEAVDAIPAYVERDPIGAGNTLQSLYDSMVEEYDRLSAQGDQQTAKGKSDVALLLARQLVAWMERRSELDPMARRRILLQEAQACLRAGLLEEALTGFERILQQDRAAVGTDRGDTNRDGADRRDASSDDAQLRYGLAETLYQLADYDGALTEFNRLATSLPPEAPMRWQALLRDLQCRTAMKEPPDGVVKVIEQQRYLYPELGGPALAEEFEKLLRENRRRVDDAAP